MKACSFFGHRDTPQTEELKQKVRETVERLIVEEGVDTFLFGSRSKFDELCHIVVTELKEKYPHIQSFSGVLDGNGHTIYNSKNINKNYAGVFTYINEGAVIKNIGFYNVSTIRDNGYSYGLVYTFNGTMENVSFHQNPSYKMVATIGSANAGCTINNLVIYAPNATTSGFFNSGSSANIEGEENIYVFASNSNKNSTAVATGYFAMGTTGMDYLTTDEYKAIDFTTIFDCAANGIWEMDVRYGIPMIKRPDSVKWIGISSYGELKALADSSTSEAPATGNYMLTTDIDCGGQELYFASFGGVLDGNGHTIYNSKNVDKNYAGVFTYINEGAVIKNIGFYNVSTIRNNKYSYGLAYKLYGTLENVSFHQNSNYSMVAMIGTAESGCTINNLVIYATNVTVSGFFNSGSSANIAGEENIYIFSNLSNKNSTSVATGYFATGTTGTDYLDTDAYKAIDFTTIFDCSVNGMWEMDETLGIPLIKRP